nr:MAG TPA: minor tail protein [Caudoviricetes sp.]
MANNNQGIEYKFDGDARGLRNATADAIKSLAKLESAFKRAAMVKAVDATSDATQKFATRIKTATNSAKSLGNQVNKFNQVGAKAMSRNISDLEKVTSTLDKLGAVMGNATRIDPKSMEVFLGVLSKASKELAHWNGISKAIAANAPAETGAVRQSAAAIEDQTRKVVQATAANKNLKNSLEDTNTGFSNAETGAIKWIQISRSLTDQTGSSLVVAFRNLKAQLSEVTPNFQNMGQSVKNSVSGSFEEVKNTLGTFIAYITKKLPTVAPVINSLQSRATTAFTSLKKSSSQVWSSLRRVGKQAKNSGNDFKEFTKDTDKSSKSSNTFGAILATVANKLSTLTKRTNSYNKASRTMRGLTRLLSTAFYKLTGLGVGEWIGSMSTASMDFVENMNLFKVAMGDAVDEGQKFVDTMSEMYGLDANSLIKYAGNFYQLSDAINMPTEAAAKLSLGLTKATVDIASLFNQDFDTVFNSLASGMQGMTKAVRKFGMDVRVVTLQAKAMELGIYQDVDAMSEADRQALRYIVMMEQAANANSDFARTIEAPANQLKIFKEQTMALGRAIGNFFITPLQKALQYVNGFVMALRTAISFIGSLLGVASDFSANVDLSGATDQMSGLGSAASDATKSVKGLLAPFDQLNVISQSSGSAGGGLGDSEILNPKLAEAIAGMDTDLTKIKMRAQEVREAILSFWGFDYNMNDGVFGWSQEVLKANLQEKFPQWSKTIDAFFNNWTRNTQSFQKIWSGFGKIVSDVIDDITEGFRKLVPDESLANFIDTMSDRLEKFGTYLDQNHEKVAQTIETIAKWAIGLKIAGTVLSPLLNLTNSLVGLLGKLNLAGITSRGIFGPTGLLIKGLELLKGGFSALLSPVGLIITAFVLLMSTSEDFRTSIGETLQVLWDLLKPIVDVLLDIVSIVTDEILPIALDVIGLIGDALAPIIDLINEVLASLQPLVDFIAETFTEAIQKLKEALQRIGNGLKDFFAGIRDVIQGIVEVIQGILEGDFKKIGHGLLKIFAGVLNAISGVVESVVNAITGTINQGVQFIWGLIAKFVNGIIGGVNNVLDFIGLDTISWRMNVEAPQIPELKIPRVEVPAFATGGVVTGPTMGVLGEAGRDEAVIPLDNSPQMRNFISEIVSAINDSKGGQDQPTVIKVFVGNEQLDEYIYKSQKRRDLRTNGG